MRGRSNTVYSKQSPFKKTDCEQAQPVEVPIPTPKPSIEDSAKLFEDFGPMTMCHMKDSFSGDYCCQNAQSAGRSTACTSLNDVRSRETSMGSSDDFEEENAKINKFFRGMVIGSGGSSKHALVNALYANTCEEISKANNMNFDLMTKHVERGIIVERYHFWLKEAGEQGKHHTALMNVYYRSCSTFFLVYNEDDKQSFQNLEQEIQTIRRMNLNKEIMIVLLRIKSCEEKCQVSLEEAQKFQDDHNIKMNFEIDQDLKDLSPVKALIGSRMK